jgi:hypothetical protein
LFHARKYTRIEEFRQLQAFFRFLESLETICRAFLLDA